MCGIEKSLISVIMGIRYTKPSIAQLQRSINSVLCQTYSDFELLICDDGSTSDARQYLESLKDLRVKLVRQDDCLDLASKLNLCLRQAKGQYIARMDDDDWSHPERFEREILYLTQNENVAFVGCNVTLIQNGVNVGERCFPEKPAVKDFYFTQPFIHPSLMFRKDMLETVGGYCESKRCFLCEDYDLLLRLYEHGFLGANIQEILLDYSIPATARGNRTMVHRWNEVLTRWKHFKALKQFPRALPYVVKPLVVGMLPEKLLAVSKKRLQSRNKSTEVGSKEQE